MRDWTNTAACIVGLGRTGQAVARYLHHRGARVFVTEFADSPAIAALAESLRSDGIDVETGGHTVRALEGDPVVILSPGVPANIPLLVDARAKGLTVVSELEAVWADAQAPIAALTGTNGKTTTTALLHHMLGVAGKVSVLCGNNDLPLSAALMHGNKPDWYVVEVSSYQLENATTFRPRVAAVLNVTPDHPRHGGLDQYAAIKARIFQAQGAGDVGIVNQDNPWTRGMAVPEGVTRVVFSADACDGAHLLDDEVLLRVDEIPQPGRHNLENVLAAMAMARAMGLSSSAIAEGVRTFKGVPHRIEFVARVGEIPYYNDSKSTNVDSLRVALASFDQPLVLIAGGRGKDSDYAPLAAQVRDRVATLVLIGEDAPKMEAAWAGAAPCHRADTMAEAVRTAAACAAPGEVVLLSPGCASFDWYNNFEERGDDFRACVNQLAATAQAREAANHGA